MNRFFLIIALTFISELSFSQLNPTFSEETYRTETHPFTAFLSETESYSVSDKLGEVLYVVQNLKRSAMGWNLSSYFSIEKYDKSGKLLIANTYDFTEKNAKVGIKGLLPMSDKLFLSLIRYDEEIKATKITLHELNKNTLELIGNPIVIMDQKITTKYGSLAMDFIQSSDQLSMAVVYYNTTLGIEKVKTTTYFLDSSGKLINKLSFNCRDMYAQQSRDVLLTNNGTLYLSFIANATAGQIDLMKEAMKKESKKSKDLINYNYSLIGVNSVSNDIYNYVLKDKNIQFLTPSIAIDKADNIHLGSIALKKSEHKSGLYKEILSSELKSIKVSFTDAELIYNPRNKRADQEYLKNYTFDQIILDDGSSFFSYEIWTFEESYVNETKTRVVDNYFEINVLPFNDTFEAGQIKVYDKYQRTQAKFSSISSYVVFNKGKEAYLIYNGRRGAVDSEKVFMMNYSTKNDIKYIKLSDKCYPVAVLNTPDDKTKVSTRIKGGPFFILNSEWKSKIMFLE